MQKLLIKGNIRRYNYSESKIISLKEYTYVGIMNICT